MGRASGGAPGHTLCDRRSVYGLTDSGKWSGACKKKIRYRD